MKNKRRKPAGRDKSVKANDSDAPGSLAPHSEDDVKSGMVVNR